MHIKQLTLKNYGRFEDLTIDFAPTAEKTSNVTVIVGNNGAGKSQILQALATGLSWFVNVMMDKSGIKADRKIDAEEYIKFPHAGEYIKQSQIMHHADQASLGLVFFDSFYELSSLSIEVTRKKLLEPPVYGQNSGDINRIIDKYTQLFKENKNTSLPILANYTVDRNVEVNDIQASYSFALSPVFAYSNFLNSGSDYQSFFQWFRDNEDIENEANVEFYEKNQEISEKVSLEIEIHELFKEKNDIENIIDNFDDEEQIFFHKRLARIIEEVEQRRQDLNHLNSRNFFLDKFVENKQFTSLDSVRHAIEYFTDFKNPRIRRQPKPTMIVEKDGEELDVNQLSQGEKSLLALVGDIARRLAILNPSMDNPLEGNGVVMIDEVDLHLHPKWQHDLIDKLVKTFPNVQFILTTHSPHVISDRNDILLYALEDGELIEMPNVYGEDVNTVLTKVMDVDVRDSKVEAQLNAIRRAISEQNFAHADTQISQLAKELPTDHLELLKCRLMLAQAKLETQSSDADHAKN